MPDSRSRSRSRSPRRNRDSGRSKNGGGFRWKEKRRDEERENDRRLERGYRDRDQRRDRDREQEREREKPASTNSGYRDREVERPTRTSDETVGAEKHKKVKKEKKAVVPVAPAEAMIIVNVNDRLGTKAAIPCLASDPIKLFKAQVAARIGREPHEIMLKRQGERPFKDQLTLEDYGVSNGVQLDLEVDTGD